MHLLLLTKYFFLLVFLVMYTESHIVIPTMKPNLQELFIAPGEKLDIECSSTQKIKFFYKPFDKTRLSLPRIQFVFKEKENGIHTMKIQINETQYFDTGSFGCGHNKKEDEDVRWIKVGLISPTFGQFEDILNYEKNTQKYIEVKKNDSFQITCNHTQKMIIRRYISPWLCCILPIENEPNETDTIMIYKKDRRNTWTQGLYGCNHCEKYRNNFMNAKISQDEINGNFILNLEKNKAVLGDSGWYACNNFENKRHPLIHWTYVYVKPEKYLFVDINDFKAITVDVNKTLTIPCRPKSPNYQVTLYANKTKINGNGNVIFSNLIGFIIENVQLKDNGYYECRITLNGITEEKGFDVLVTEPNNMKPTMYPDLSYIELEENQLLNLTCTSTQRPYFFVYPWMLSQFMNWHTKPLEEETHEVLNGIHTSKLQVKTSPQDTGFYGCANFQLNYMDSGNNDMALELNNMNIRWIYVYVKAKPRIKKSRINKYYESKEIAEIKNTVVAFPSSNIRLILEESNSHLEIQNMTNIVRDISNREFMVTTLVSLSWTPARNIMLTFFNDAGNDSIIVPLFSDDKPLEFGIIGPNKNVVVGDTLELTCIGSLTNSLDTLRWISSYNPAITAKFNSRTNIKLLEYDDIGISILTISSVKKSDENIYHCETEDTVYNYMLNVNELKKPHLNHTNMNKIETKYETRGKSIVLTCYVDGVPEPIITWSKNNFQINTTYPNIPNDICKYEFRNKDQELYIGYLHDNCFGNYSCRADNYLGHWETYQQILIEGPAVRNI